MRAVQPASALSTSGAPITITGDDLGNGQGTPPSTEIDCFDFRLTGRGYSCGTLDISSVLLVGVPATIVSQTVTQVRGLPQHLHALFAYRELGMADSGVACVYVGCGGAGRGRAGYG